MAYFIYFFILGVWPFNEHAMMDKVCQPTFSLASSSIRTNAPSRNILMSHNTDLSTTPSNTSSYVNSSTSQPSITLDVPSTDFINNSTSTFYENTTDNDKQTLAEIQIIEPLQPTLLDDDISLPKHSIYTTLQPIEFVTPTTDREPFHTAKPAQDTNTTLLLMSSSGNYNHL